MYLLPLDAQIRGITVEHVSPCTVCSWKVLYLTYYFCANLSVWFPKMEKIFQNQLFLNLYEENIAEICRNVLCISLYKIPILTLKCFGCLKMLKLNNINSIYCCLSFDISTELFRNVCWVVLYQAYKIVCKFLVFICCHDKGAKMVN